MQASGDVAFTGKRARCIPRADVNRRLLRYWLGKRGRARQLPGRPDVDPAELKPVLPFLLLIDVEGPPLRFRFRLVGTELVRVYGREYTGLYLDDLDLDGQARTITCDFTEAAEAAVPHCDEYAYVMDRGRVRHFERLLLPLARDGRNVDMLLGSLHEFTFDPRASPSFYPEGRFYTIG